MNNINNLLLADELGWNKKNNKKYKIHKKHKLIDLQSVVLLVPHVPLLITVVSAL